MNLHHIAAILPIGLAYAVTRDRRGAYARLARLALRREVATWGHAYAPAALVVRAAFRVADLLVRRPPERFGVAPTLLNKG